MQPDADQVSAGTAACRPGGLGEAKGDCLAMIESHDGFN
jgi:hypothetical protein